jgi:hypothetical protein
MRGHLDTPSSGLVTNLLWKGFSSGKIRGGCVFEIVDVLGMISKIPDFFRQRFDFRQFEFHAEAR